MCIKNFLFIPIVTLPIITKLNSFLLKFQIESLVETETIIWVTYPSHFIPNILKGMKYSALVYEMMDDYPNIHSESKEQISRIEAWFVDNASLVIATSEALAEKAKRMKRGVKVRLIGNGVDYDFFNHTPKVRPPEFKGMKGIVGYVGTVDKWIDFDLVDFLAKNRPDLDFFFVGPIRVKRISLRENIHYVGPIDYERVPTYCEAFDVCLIPFLPGEFADTINPVKLYEYLALGKPVVSYHMKELERYKDIIYLSVAKEDFLKNVETALNENDSGIREVRKDIARANDWNMISEIVHEKLLKLSAP